jgi:hypothetical protein
MPGGADAQIGWATESVVGTITTPTKFMPFLSESIKQSIDYMDSKTLSSRRTIRITKKGRQTIEGTVNTELGNTTLATLLKHCFGTAGVTGSGPYVHTFTPGDLTGKSMTVQVGRPATTGTVHPFTYAGCKVAKWTIGASDGEIATFSFDLLGMTETTGTALATASYDSTWAPFVFTEASLTVAAGAENTVRSFNLTGENMVQGRTRLGSGTSKQPLEIGVRNYTGTIETDFDALTDYALFVAGTNAALVVTFNNGTQTLVITMNIQFTGETPNVSGDNLLAQSLPYRCLSSTSDAAAISAVLTNSETTSA